MAVFRSAKPEGPRPEVIVNPAWSLPRGVIVLVALAATVVAVAGMKAFSDVLGPTFLALMLVVAVHPIQDWFRRRGWPLWIGMATAVLTIYAFLLALVGSLVLSATQLVEVAPQYEDKFDSLLDSTKDLLARFGFDSDKIRDTINSIDLGKVAGYVEAGVDSALGVLSNVVFVLALTLFMAFDAMTVHKRLEVVSQYRPEIAYAFGKFASGTRSYLVVSTVFGLIVAVLDSVALAWMGIPLAVLWGVLSFITNYIPNIGFVLGLVPPALLGLLQGGWWLLFWVVVVYSVINFVIQSLIQPKFVGDAVGLSVSVTFLALVFWGWVLGPLGAFLALPLSLLVKALLLDIDPTTRWADALIRSGPMAPELLATDPDETPASDEQPAPKPDLS